MYIALSTCIWKSRLLNNIRWIEIYKGISQVKFFTVIYCFLVATFISIMLIAYGPGLYKSFIESRVEKKIEESNEDELRRLITRFKAGDITDVELEKRIDVALKSQSELDYDHPEYPIWNSTWGEFIETVHSAGLLSAERWSQYALNSIYFTVCQDNFLKQGNSIPTYLQMRTRLGPFSRFRVEYRVQYSSMQKNGSFVHLHNTELDSQNITMRTEGTSYFVDLPLNKQRLSQNRTDFIKASVFISIFDNQNNNLLLAQGTKEIKRQITQSIFRNMASVKLSYGLADKLIIQNGLKFNVYKSKNWEPNNFVLDFTPINIPKDMKCYIWLRSRSKEWGVNTHYGMEIGNRFRTSIDLLGLDADVVDIVIRPSIVNDKWHSEVYPYDVNELEIVVRDVPVKEFVIKK